MNDFERAYALVASPSIEGGYQCDPRDKGNWTGGEVGKGLLRGTKYGISAASYPQENIKGMSAERAKEIYQTDYWDAAGCAYFPWAIALCVFDFAINSGVLPAIKTMQSCLAVLDDGFVGPKTIKAARNADPRAFVQCFQARRKAYMRQSKAWGIYHNGWEARLEKIAKEALA